MFAAASQQKIWLCTRAVDMRKSFKGLIALVRNHEALSIRLPSCGALTDSKEMR